MMFPTTTSILQLPAPAGELELTVEIPQTIQSNIIAILCHPHPLFGGTMNNKVVTTLAKVFHELQLPNVRFNFRGVGNSTGEHDNGVGEIEDLKTVIQWVKQAQPDSRIWLAGFSFGSYVAAAVAAQGGIERLISIAPPATRWHFQDITQMPCPWLVVQGDKDEVIDADEVFTWFASSHPQAEVICMHDASHFFHGRLIELRALLIEKLTPFL